MHRCQKIAITGSSGLIGSIVAEELQKQGHELVLIDVRAFRSLDLLKDDIASVCVGVETIIHLAAYADPHISAELARKNIAMTQKVIEVAGALPTLRRIVNASSVNVYPYVALFREGTPITGRTHIAPNLYFAPGEYARAKIEAEQMLEAFCRAQDVAFINLRIGAVFSEGSRLFSTRMGWRHRLRRAIFLSREDVREIGRESVSMDGIRNYVCVSKPSWFIRREDLFPLARHAKQQDRAIIARNDGAPSVLGKWWLIWISGRVFFRTLNSNDRVRKPYKKPLPS